jgi:AcrR family transcriptional regulator
MPSVSTSRIRTQRRERREQTRQQILEAAESFLREHPFRELSLDVVMAQTQLTRTAFYRHFDDVSQLVLQLLADVGRELYDVARDWAAEVETDFEAAAREGLRDIVAFFERHGPLVRAVADAAATDEQVDAGYTAFLGAFDEVIVRGLDSLVAGGGLEPCDTHALARALNRMNERYLLDEFGREPTGDPATAFATLELVWMRTVGGTRPRRRRG